jgi:hypothetical protein
MVAETLAKMQIPISLMEKTSSGYQFRDKKVKLQVINGSLGGKSVNPQ